MTTPQLIQGKRYYWVEPIAYNVTACRILITDKDRDSLLTPYEPTLKTGPWWFDTDGNQHYFNDNHCLEFMVEAPISLNNLSNLDFVGHHHNYCSIHRNNPEKCSEIGIAADSGSALFLTRSAVTKIDLSALSKHFVAEDGKPTRSLSLPDSLRCQICLWLSDAMKGQSNRQPIGMNPEQNA